MLKDQSNPEDPRLDRLVSFDPKSKNFPVRARLTAAQQVPRNRRWRCDLWLDQGHLGSCVGNGVTHELAATPAIVQGLNEDFAVQLYHEAQDLDEWPGHDYEGTTVIAGAKAAQKRGYFESYHWGFNLNDLILGVGYHGPAVIGIPFYESMFTPDNSGYVYIEGDVAGGHCMLVRGVDVTHRSFLVKNSWGIGWGMASNCYIRFDDMERLLHEDGEAVFFERRHSVVQNPT